jgi:hypothetical protein
MVFALRSPPTALCDALSRGAERWMTLYFPGPESRFNGLNSFPSVRRDPSLFAPNVIQSLDYADPRANHFT